MPSPRNRPAGEPCVKEPEFFDRSGLPRLAPVRLYKWKAFEAEARAARATHQLAAFRLQVLLDRNPEVAQAIREELDARRVAVAENDALVALCTSYTEVLGFPFAGATIDDVT